MVRENKILLVGDHESRRHEMRVILEFVGETAIVSSSKDWKATLKEFEQNTSDILALIIDHQVDHLEQLLTDLRQWDPGIPVLLMGDADLTTMDPDLRRMVISKFEFPPNYNKFLDNLYRAQVYREQYAAHRARGQQRDVTLFRSLVGTSRAIQRVRELMAQVADKEVSVLVTGESGTGKEVVARNLHYHSSRRNKPFVPVNCGAIPAELLESELFGHEKGAFTGAISSRVGRFELAEGGTLFLDEIGDMPLNMQVKILRVLQERTYERVGSNKTMKADVRIIAATHKNLEEMIKRGEFREDLYYRLNVFPIEMPALRERTEDIPLLINELVSRMEKEKRGSIRFNSAAILSLCRHEWHGNVRELANLVERLAIMYPYGVIGVQELPKKFRHVDDLDENMPTFDMGEGAAEAGVEGLGVNGSAVLPPNGLDLKEYLNNLEKSLIQQALDEAGGVVARAAERLRIRRTTLVEKVRKYGLKSKDDKDEE